MSMDHWLINPNQIWMMEMLVFDDPFDENQKIGIAHKKVFIPFKTDGTTLYFDSRVPKQRDITECTHIFMPGETE